MSDTTEPTPVRRIFPASTTAGPLRTSNTTANPLLVVLGGRNGSGAYARLATLGNVRV